MSQKHVIEVWEEGGRSCWACDCGTGGSTPHDDADVQAEKHIGEDEQVAYRRVDA